MKRSLSPVIPLCLLLVASLPSNPVFGQAASGQPAGQMGAVAARDSRFDTGWHFFRATEDHNAAKTDETDPSLPPEAAPGYRDNTWDQVNLPHTPRIESYKQFLPWQGLCWYRKTFVCPQSWSGKRVSLEFQGAMQVAEVWVNGSHRLTHNGGFLPFTLDLSRDVTPGKVIVVAARLDNRDNGLVPPGKPLRGADFEYYGGLYRDVILHVTDPLHITNAVAANKVAGGGLFVTFPRADTSAATVRVQSDVVNEFAAKKSATVICTLTDSDGKIAAVSLARPVPLAPGTDGEIVQEFQVKKPRLWSPDHPNLYRLHVTVKDGTRLAYSESILIGIRRFEFSVKTGFSINGHSLFLHGGNRHQYYPWIGNALSDNEQYRDMVRMKEEGWNIVRLCHYPQSAQIMDACDRLGLIALVCSPGWQWYSGDPVFVSGVDQADRDMVRWHRNHASALLWEVTLNEEYAPIDKVKQWGQSIHQELPGDQCFLSGDTKDYGDPKDFALDAPYPGWNNAEHPEAGADTSRKRLVREYGAQAQANRDDGDANMVNMARVAQESYSDLRRAPWNMGCIRWSYMDYVRGYAPDPLFSGSVTIDRLPKFLFYFYKSQFPPDLKSALYDSGPMVYIANYWKSNSPKTVTVYSNCDQVELFLNGVSLGKKSPDTNNAARAVAHPPFTFPDVTFAPGTLTAIGYVGNRRAATAAVATPGQPAGIKLIAEQLGRPLTADGADVVFLRAEVVDSAGTLIPDASVPIQFSASENGSIVGDNPRMSGAGISSCLLRAGLTPGPITVTATSPGLGTASLVVPAVRPDPTLPTWQ